LECIYIANLAGLADRTKQHESCSWKYERFWLEHLNKMYTWNKKDSQLREELKMVMEYSGKTLL
jgi:hypothetical protein